MNLANRRAPSPVAAGGEVPELNRAQRRIAAEFERARRYERSVTVAVFAAASDVEAAKGNGGSALFGDHDPHGPHLCSLVRQAVREIDVVVCDPVARRCVVVMPEIGAEEGRRAVARMRQLCATRLDCHVRGDLAVFPQDGWVFTDLVETAQKQAASGGDPGLVPVMGGRATL